MTTVVAVVLAGVVAFGRPSRRARRHREPVPDAALAGSLVLLALRAGASVTGALEAASVGADPATGRALRRLAHVARVGGVGAARDGAAAELAPMLAVLARADAVGAPAAAELDAHLREAARDEHATAVARARSLPVRLAVPLTLLILPGVALLTVGPSVVATLSGLADPTGLLP